MSDIYPKLILPDVSYHQEFLYMVDDFKIHEESFYQEPNLSNLKGFTNYVNYLNKMGRGGKIDPGLVPMITYWLISDDRHIVGISRFRLVLNETLLTHGGHIGYDIRPGYRRMGWGTLILMLTLNKAREMKYEKVLVTCAEDNSASKKIIEANGGQFASTAVNPDNGKTFLRYWIHLL